MSGLRTSLFAWLVACATSLFALTTPAPADAQTPAVLRRARIDANRLVDFHAVVTPETVFVNQQTTYQVAVLLDQAADGRLPRNPEYLPPELRGMLAYELGGQNRFSHQANGKNYTAYVFQKALFPLAPGTITIPAPQLTYALRQNSSYFSREDSHSIRAESSTVIVRPLPDEGKPADFGGAVGVLKAEVELDAATARVGDPLVLTLRISGSGNIKLLPRPTLEISWATSVAGTERLSMDTSSSIVKGSKEFDWILTPTRAGDVETPSISYPYFNPNTREYANALAAPVVFSVNAGTLAAAETGERAASSLQLRGHEVGTVGQPLLKRWEVLAALALLPLPAIALFLVGIPRAEPEAEAIEKLRALVVPAPSSGRTVAIAHQPPQAPQTARDVRRLLLASLARRLHLRTEVLTDRKRARRALLRKGVTPETTAAVLDQLHELDLASFAPADHATAGSNVSVPTLSAAAIALYDRIHSEALDPLVARAALAAAKTSKTVIVLAVASLALMRSADLHAQSAASDGLWERGTQSYTNRRYVDAAAAFLELANQSPRNPDVLVNWGVSAWAAGDTVSAVVAWQRAARLDPLAADVREHLLLLPSGSRDGVAEVPMISVGLLTIVGIALWAAGWMLAAWIFWRRKNERETHAVIVTLAPTLLVIAIACAAGAMWGESKLRTDGLAVVLRPETLRATPETGADAQGGASTGDVVRIDQVVPRWAHVEHSDGRTGWMPADRLTPLADAAQ
ncbi:MAG: BatD family protein [Gemmatimonas sp.]